MEIGVFLRRDIQNFSQLVTYVREIEKLTYESIWMDDHLIGFQPDYKQPYFECFTSLSALGSNTSKIRLGVLVSCYKFRHPLLTSKIVATLDHITNGRISLGLGACWYQKDFSALGIKKAPLDRRINELKEYIELLKLYWASATKGEFSYDGTYFKVKNGFQAPSPIQKPHPPLIIGGNTLRLHEMAAKMEAEINIDATILPTYKDAVSLAEKSLYHIKEKGYDSKKVSFSLFTPLTLLDTETDVDFYKKTFNGNVTGIIGTITQIGEILEEFKNSSLPWTRLIIIPWGKKEPIEVLKELKKI